MEPFKDTFLSEKCSYTWPWLIPPAVDDFNKNYKQFGNDPHDEQRLANWVECKRRRSLELLPMGLLIALLIILWSPHFLEPYIDYAAYGIGALAIFGYLTTEQRAKYAYNVFCSERELSGFNQKEFVNFKKRNFGPNWYEIL